MTSARYSASSTSFALSGRTMPITSFTIHPSLGRNDSASRCDGANLYETPGGTNQQTPGRSIRRRTVEPGRTVDPGRRRRLADVPVGGDEHAEEAAAVLARAEPEIVRGAAPLRPAAGRRATGTSIPLGAGGRPLSASLGTSTSAAAPSAATSQQDREHGEPAPSPRAASASGRWAAGPGRGRGERSPAGRRLARADDVLGLGDRLASRGRDRGAAEVAGGRVPVGRVLLHRPADHRIEHRGPAAAGGRRRLVHMGPHLRRALPVGERDPAGDARGRARSRGRRHLCGRRHGAPRSAPAPCSRRCRSPGRWWSARSSRRSPWRARSPSGRRRRPRRRSRCAA